MQDQEIKHRIHEKSLDHFLRFGFSKVTMNEIAEELGMSKKTLYQYFPSKEDLLAAVVTRLHEDTANQIETIVRRTDIDFLQKLRGALNALAAFHTKMTPYFRTDMEKHAPHVCKATDEFGRDRIRVIMADLVAEGIRERVFRDDIDQELIVLIYSGALQYLLRPETFNRLNLPVQRIHEIIGSVVIDGIVRPEARSTVAAQSLLVPDGKNGNGSATASFTSDRGSTAVRRNPESPDARMPYTDSPQQP
ncbi:MAG TPA: TetR/AcrR family transcriptional regulator [Bacteroidota bacterium]|nr:TetR/AcrR family transcriptional regulator [Bacteroidota bacterium]